MAGFKKMGCCCLGAKMERIINYCGLVMHGIAHTAFFLYNLLLQKH
jgi:hypothetical protein